jgi:hypothetical protein
MALYQYTLLSTNPPSKLCMTWIATSPSHDPSGRSSGLERMQVKWTCQIICQDPVPATPSVKTPRVKAAKYVWASEGYVNVLSGNVNRIHSLVLGKAFDPRCNMIGVGRGIEFSTGCCATSHNMCLSSQRFPRHMFVLFDDSWGSIAQFALGLCSTSAALRSVMETCSTNN